jgi:60 kDa SS-A/Ro ribonucleoprotein
VRVLANKLSIFIHLIKRELTMYNVNDFSELDATLKTTASSVNVKSKGTVKNSTGGYVFKVDEFKRLDRFLILGSEQGTYYINKTTLTKENVSALTKCLKANYIKTIDTIVAISTEGRCVKNETCVFAIAYASASKDLATRRYAVGRMKEICRTGTDFFAFVQYSKMFRGRGRLLNEALKDWYLSKSPEKLDYQLVKYQSRNGWSHRDVLRLCRPKATTEAHNQALKWAVKGVADAYDQMPCIYGFEQAKQATKVTEVVKLIREYRLTREMVPTQWLKDPTVWMALLGNMPYIAMLRNLGVMTANGTLKELSEAAKRVVKTLKDPELIARSRVHPIQILMALFTYKSGQGIKGSLYWNPDTQVLNALNAAFYLSFKNVKSTGKNIYIGLDVSGSMTMGDIGGIRGFTPMIAAGTMALVTVKAEENYTVKAFESSLTNVPMTKDWSLEDYVVFLRKMQFGSTNVGLPIEDAIKRKVDVDCFIIYTDNEVNQGQKAHQLLKQYRKVMNKPETKLVIVAMTSNGFSVADPNDPYMLDVVGFDSSTPAAISEIINL